MSMDDTGKWASKIIDELFEDDVNSKDPGITEAKDVVEGTMKNKSRDSGIAAAGEAMKEKGAFSGDISVGTECRSHGNNIIGSPMESAEQSKIVFLKSNDYLPISNESCNNLSPEYSVRRKHNENKQHGNEETKELGDLESSTDVSSDLQIENSSKVKSGNTNAISQYSVHDLQPEIDENFLKSEYDEIFETIDNTENSQNMEKRCQERKIITKPDVRSETSITESNYTCRFSRENIVFINKCAQLKQKSSLDNEVELRRTVKIIAMYRDVCTAVETLIITPFAKLAAESCEFIIFVLVLCACLLYLLYEKTNEKLHTFYNGGNVARLNKLSTSEKEVIVTNCNEDNNRLTKTTEWERSDKAKTQRDSINVSSGDEEFNEQFDSFNAFELIDPENVLITNVTFEQIEHNLKDIHKNGADFVEFLHKKQRRFAIKSFGDDSVNVTMQEDGTINETDSGMGIITSSNKVNYKQHESGKCDLFEMFENSSSLRKVSDENGTNEESLPFNL